MIEIPEGADAFLVTGLVNVRYLSGFTGTSAMLLIERDRRRIVTDFRYFTQAAEECPEWELVKRENGFDETIARIDGLPPRIAFEADHVPYSLYERLREKVSVAWIPTRGVVEGARMRKDAREVERLTAAARALEDLFARLLDTLRVGETEREVAVRYRRMLLDVSGEAPPFPPIVASGPRGALPHGVASDRVIEKGDLVTIDLGLVLDGYHADMTRTVVVGGPPSAGPAPGGLAPEEVHDAVRRALEAAERGIRPGMTGAEAHEVAAAVLKEAGLEEAFGHGLGHGLGLEIHEGPRLAPRGDERLEPGMVFTVEPGAYLPGWGGVRIEDAGVLTEDGFRPFNRSARGLQVLG